MSGDSARDLASSFGEAASAYAEHRPGYAPAAIRWARDLAPGRRVLDLGAGTGRLTEGLLSVGATVTAIEPDPRMLGELRRENPRVLSLSGSAEAIPLGERSVDAVLAGNAMHWFDMDAAGPEIARVLASRGVLAGLWNALDDRIGWVAELAEIAGSSVVGPRDTPAGWRTETASMHLPTRGGDVCFDSPEQAEFSNSQRRTTDSLIATLATRAGVLRASPEDRDRLLGRIRAYLESREETAEGEFDLPMQTCVLRVRKID